MVTNGVIGWDTKVDAPHQKRTPNERFLRLKDGNNVVRVLTRPAQFWKHKYKPQGAPGYGYNVYCSKEHGSCPLCDLGNKPQRRWLIGVIDRSTASYKILEISKTVFQSIQDLYNDEDWGDPVGFDINIKVNREGGATGYYSVTPKSKKPLSEADLALKDDEMDLDELVRLTQAPTPDKVTERMNKIHESVAKLTNGGGSESATSYKASAPSVSADSSDDTDESDPDYDFPEVK